MQKQKVKLILSADEIRSLVLVMFHYNIEGITNRNERIMVTELLSKLQSQLNGLLTTGNKEHKISISQGKAAAFDLAFREVPIPLDGCRPRYQIYEENVVNRVLDMINRVLI